MLRKHLLHGAGAEAVDALLRFHVRFQAFVLVDVLVSAVVTVACSTVTQNK